MNDTHMSTNNDLKIRLIGEREMRARRQAAQVAMEYILRQIRSAISIPSVGPATPGAPIRLKTGRASKSLRGDIIVDGDIVLARIKCPAKSPKGFPYPLYHERKGLGRKSGQHPFVDPTANKYRPHAGKIFKREYTRLMGHGQA